MGRIETGGGFWIGMGLLALLLPLRLAGAILLAAAIHELGHIAAISLTGGRVLSIRLSGRGGQIVTDPMEPGQEIFCALAGPTFGALTVLAWRAYPELAVAGLVQTIFNLLPFYPLDGGRVFRNICCKRRRFRVQYSEYDKHK